jgi:spore maturation protein CgeB
MHKFNSQNALFLDFKLGMRNKRRVNPNPAIDIDFTYSSNRMPDTTMNRKEILLSPVIR